MEAIRIGKKKVKTLLIAFALCLAEALPMQAQDLPMVYQVEELSPQQLAKYPARFQVETTSDICEPERIRCKAAVKANVAGWLTVGSSKRFISGICGPDVWSVDTYAARIDGPYRIKLAMREMGSAEIKEVTCKF
jgi:hypothetical protein